MSASADIILKSNCIFTAEDTAPFSGYTAVSDGYILDVGSGEIPSSLIGNDTVIFDLGDRTVCSGFCDVHCFFTGYSVGFVGADLSGCKSIEDIAEKTTAYAADITDDKPVFGHGWDSAIIQPNGTDFLDKLFGNRPAVLFASGCETCLMNQAAVDAYKFTPETCYPEAYVNILPLLLQDRNFIIPEFKKYMSMLNGRGITSVKDMGFDDFYGFTDILEELEAHGELTLRVNFMSQPVAQPINLNYGNAMRKKFDGEFVRFSGYNQMTDGSISQLCGELKQPYCCAPKTTCAQDIDWDRIAAETHMADKEGFRFSLHAQGDAAISKVLDIYETCKRDKDGRVVNRHGITDLEFSDPKDIERMGKLGIIAEIYPQIQSLSDRKSKLAMIKDKIGNERSKYYWNRRKMQDSGVVLSCGTDLPLLIDDIPQSVYHAVGGYFADGAPAFNTQNMLTISELLTAWTKGGAYNLYCEDELGTLSAGKKADIAVLSGNIFTIPVEESRNLSVDMTIVGGKIVYRTNNLAN